MVINNICPLTIIYILPGNVPERFRESLLICSFLWKNKKSEKSRLQKKQKKGNGKKKGNGEKETEKTGKNRKKEKKQR